MGNGVWDNARGGRDVIAGLFIHLFVWAAACGSVTAVWLLTGGSPDELERIVQDPAEELNASFWPVWVWLGAAAAITVHLGVVLSLLLFGSRNRRQRVELARQAARAAARLSQQAARTVQEAKERHMAAHGRMAWGPHSAAEPDQTEETPTQPERRWVTVMFTDLADSTKLTEKLGDEEWHKVLAPHREFCRAAFLARGGQVVGSQGDGFLARFPTPAEAVWCAVEIQRELDRTASDTGLPLKLRVGIHAGEAVEDDGDLVGRVVNVASRVTARAEPGEILVTEPVADYLAGRLHLEDRGLHPLRGIAQPRHLLAVPWGEEPEVAVEAG
jgi:class 3 adenylate cyclase